MKKRVLKIILALILTMNFLSITVQAEPAGEEMQEALTEESSAETAAKYDRTILMYCCGSDLETDAGLATYNLKNILSSNFSKDEKVKFIVMTGGAYQWYMESTFLYDPSKGAEEQPEEISSAYNQIWEAVGADAVLENGEKNSNAGKLVLLDGDGILGDGPDAVPAEVEDSDEAHEWMSDPEVLKAFINFGVEQFPADKYDLILWDHGEGPARNSFAQDEHDPDGVSMRFSELVDALYNNNLIDPDGDGMPDRKYDFLNFDACLMSSMELILAFDGLTDCYIASPESIPGYGEVYEGWLNALGNDPTLDAYEIGKIAVDDFYNFYENGYDNGTKQEGTLAVINLRKLMDGGFASALNTLNEVLAEEIADGMVYDELTAVRNSIQYGKKPYFDFGNVVSQLGIPLYEKEGEDDTNAYTPVAKTLLGLMADPDILYAKGTSGIKTGDFFYLNGDGEIKYCDRESFPMGTSGIYSYFLYVKELFEVDSYFSAMMMAFDRMPEGENKEVLKDFLENQVKLTMLVRVAQLAREALNEKNEDGTPAFTKETLNYDTLREYYSTPNEYASWYTEWKSNILEFASMIWNHKDEYPKDQKTAEDLEEKTRAFLEDSVNEIIQDEVLADQIDLYTVTYADGTGYQLRFHDTKKRMIADVSAKIYAEMPAAEAYMEQVDIRGLVFEEGADIPLAQMQGREKYDLDMEEAADENFMDAYIRWLNNDNATWDVGAMEDKCYALRDEEGNLHVCRAEQDGEKMLTMGAYPVEETTIDDEGNEETELIYWPVGLYFTDGVLTDLMLKGDDGTWRPTLLEDLKRELTLVPASDVLVFLTKVYVPLSSQDRAFTVSADSHLELVFTDVKNIPDVQDRNGDGEILTRKIIVTDVFGMTIDMTDATLAPAGNLIDIALTEVEPAYYNGTELSPRITYNGTVLTEGVDYKLFKMTDDVIFREVGEYFVMLQGIGNFTGSTFKTYTILPGKEDPKEPDVSPDEQNERAADENIPDTGDPNDIGFWILIMVLSFVLAAGAGVYFRIRKE